MKKEIRIYNVIFPIWMLILFPPTWIAILPLNFIIDSVVLLVALKFIIKNTDIRINYKKSILYIWIFGFVADIVGTFTLFFVDLGFSNLNNELISKLDAIHLNPFDNMYAFLYVLLAVIVTAFLIFVLNYRFSFNKVELSKMEKIKVCLTLSILTAPYTFFIPTEMIYNL